MKASHAIKKLTKLGFNRVDPAPSANIAFMRKGRCMVAVFFNGPAENDKCGNLRIYTAGRAVMSGVVVKTIPQAMRYAEKYLSGEWT